MKQEPASVLQPDNLMMEPQAISIDVLQGKYAKNDEKTIQDVRRRVAKALASIERDQPYWEDRFFQCQENGFVPAGRINSAAGMNLHATLINCFVQPLGDCIRGFDDNGYPSIYEALGEAAETMRRGGGVGYDFSRILPAMALVKGTQSRASGPLSFMAVFDRSCNTVESAGARRGAQMGVLRCDHPDIEAFIHAKDKVGEFTNFNLSVGVTDAFMKAVDLDGPFELIHKVRPGDDYIAKHNSYFKKEDNVWVWRVIAARDLWDQMMKSTYDHAEPGILFLDQMNRENNLYYCEKIEATNPCAEQPLPPYGCCDLGSGNLTKFVRNPLTPEAYFDYDAYGESIKTSIRMLDDVLDATEWPLEKQQQEAMNKRRIGYGFLGLGDAIMMMGYSYDKEDGVAFASAVSEFMRDAAYEASIELAIEKGPFPLFDADKYLDGVFVKRLPERIRGRIREHGIRNSHLLSIAPTGTITLAFADNASNGIEPPFSWAYTRKKRRDDGVMEEFEVADYAWRLYRAKGGDMVNLPKNFVTAQEIEVDAHIAVMKAVQPYCDTSISKTVNIPVDYPYEDFKDLYMKAWKAGLKGLATYRPNAVTGSILSVKEETKPVTVAAIVDENTVDVDNGKTLEEIVKEMYHQRFESREDGSLPGTTYKGRFFTDQGEQKFLVTVNMLTLKRHTRFGVVVIRRPVEFLLESNFTTSKSAWNSGMRNTSLAARSGANVIKIIENMRETTWEHGMVRCGTRLKDGKQVPLWHQSDAAAIGYIIEEELKKDGFLNADGKMSMKYVIETESGALAAVWPTSIEWNKDVAPVLPANVEIIADTVRKPMAGKLCGKCGVYAVVRRDGCDMCDACGEPGACG